MTVRKVTDQTEIDRILRAYMMEIEEQPAPFLIEIFSREHRPGGIIYEGARPIGAVHDNTTGERTYALSNGDSNYQSPIASVNVKFIEYVSIFV